MRYAGQYADAETGLYYNGFRYYDPLTGRYLQPDPLGLSGGLNSYTYALNNPLRYIDPEGQNPVAILLIWTARFAVGWAIDYLIGYLPDNECNPLLSLQRWANAASYAVGISAAQKGVKALTAAAKLRRGLGGAGKGTSGTNNINVNELNFTKTVENHLSDLNKAGDKVRPYGDSKIVIQEIMNSQKPVTDPRGVPGALRWDVEGTMNGSKGKYELVIDPKTNTVLHFLFKSEK